VENFLTAENDTNLKARRMKLIEFPGRKKNNNVDGQESPVTDSGVCQNDASEDLENLSFLLDEVGDWIESEVPKIHEEDLSGVDPFEFSSLISEFRCFDTFKGQLNVRRICKEYNAQKLSNSQEVGLEFVLAILIPDCLCFDIIDAFSVLEKEDRLTVLRILQLYESRLND